MTNPNRRVLQLDDPLGPSHPARPAEPSAPASAQTVENGPGGATERPSTGGRSREPEAAARPATASSQEPYARTAAGQMRAGAWRTWSGITSVGSFRLPHELLSELGDRARELRLPIGMIVTAAITQLLDQPPEAIAELVDRADDARIHGRRRARRRRTESAGD